MAIPADPTTVDPAWMTAALAGVAAGAAVVGVDFVGYIGTGQMGRNARYALRWDADAGAGDRPASVVAKFPTDDPTGRASGFGNGSFRNEWMFYRHLAGTVRVRSPRCHLALFDEAAQDFVLVMEDMAGSAQGDQMRGLTVDEAALAVEQAVALHAPRWGDESLAELVLRSPEESAVMLDAVYAATMHGTLARLGPGLTGDAVDLVHRLAPLVGRWVSSVDVPPTLVHMDFRPDNLLFGVAEGAPPLTVVDWQTVTAGPGTHDLAYVIGGSFEPDDRRRVERDLVAEYVDRLAAAGVDYPVDRCWEHYRLSSLWGVVMSVIATMLAAQTERGDLMLTTMLRRHAQHAIDLDALATLAALG